MGKVKKLLAAVVFLLAMVSFEAGVVFAQNLLETKSNSVTTRVGNPPASASFCPIPNGTITCGSKNVPVNGCGHCGIGYEAHMANCTYEGINYAMDVAGSDFQEIILPSIQNVSISWTFVGESIKGNQAIQQYSGTNLSTGEKYWIYFHHTSPGSGSLGTHVSGERGAAICGNGCNMGHVHIEFARIETVGKPVWLDGPNYFCG